MNILTDVLPKKIKVDNQVYDINYDYKTIINIILAFEDEELTYDEKVFIMIKNLYKEEIPEENYVEACEKAIKFIDLGEEQEKNNEERELARTYSFKKDASYIFSGINQTHHIDIEEKNDMHWWKFMSLFMDMSPECMFGELIYYRKRKLEGKLTKEEKANYEKIKKLVDLDYVKKPSEAKKKFFEEFYRNKK